jgi:hypothetical protein
LPVVGAFEYDTVIPTKATDPIMVELPPREVETYEVRLYNFERKSYQNLVASTLLTRPIAVTRTGHYVVEYRGCNGVGTGRVCTSWAPSTDPLLGPRTRKQDGTLITRGWWIYQYVRPPGPIEIR